MRRLPAIGPAVMVVAAGCNALFGLDPGEARPTSGGASTGQAGAGLTGGASGAGGEAGSGLGVIEQPCVEPGDCPSGYHCVDGTCCTTGCDGVCEACNLGGSIGECRAQPAGADPDEECPAGVCDGSGACASGAAEWSWSFGDPSDGQRGTAVATDAVGNVFLTGSFVGAIDFRGRLLDAGLRPHAFVAKFAASDTLLWCHLYGDEGEWSAFYGYGVAAATERVALTGSLAGTADFGCGAETGLLGADAFVALLHTNDDCLWSHAYGAILSAETGRDVAFDEDGHVVIVGSHFGTLDFGEPTLPGGEAEDGFVVELDQAGQHVWSLGIRGPEVQRPRAVAVGASRVVVAGTFRAAADFGSGPVGSAGGYDGFVAQYDDAGVLGWSRVLGDAADQEAWDVALDREGNAVVVGDFEGTVDFGGGVLTSAGDEDIFVVKLDPEGNPLWGRAFGDAAAQAALGVAIDRSGNVVVVGRANGAVDFGGGVRPPLGGDDAVMAKFDPNGVHLWSQRFGAAGSQLARAVAADGQGHLVITGEFTQQVNFGGATHTSAGGTDIFVAKFSP